MLGRDALGDELVQGRSYASVKEVRAEAVERDEDGCRGERGGSVGL